ncbi:uncharacterized protein KY384_004193 [Bacidia gigantensis]|uniref:uncharacterized protein n=1 Tax=Bacidia gigantensis TaxID=2732470 RepID=UPI001D038E72|nr:uncharacterized protein KY384_004193 [Bacidia gigantensis]KAG8530836.1 hypothetical protein KY384_004193 [Bacidia gigantensis]
MVAPDEPSQPTWKFTQCFGDKGDVEDITEADIISTVEFDHTGNYLATGDKGGRVVLFERNETKKTCEYKFHTEFQSHEPEFDYLKSLEIEEKINKIKWCRRQNASHYLLSTNDKTIKLWKVFEKSLKVVAENNLSHDLTPGGALDASALKLPRLTHHDTVVAAVPRRNYANAHAYHINSISVNSDGETFISSDDLRINLWNLNIQDQSFNIVDIKPANMEELTEVITAAEFHPQSCNWFMYASSKGTIKLADMRENALCDQHAKQFEQEEDPSARSFFSEIISSISDVRFSHDGRYILSRDYLTVKIWDVNMERTPVKTIPIHEHLRPRLCDTYENDSIFDKFEVVFSGDAKNVMTGSYNNNFMIYPSDAEKETEVVLQADKSAFKQKKIGVPTPINSASASNGGPSGKKGGSRAGSPAAGAGQGARMKKETDADQIDFNKKILHMSWHPFEDSIAIAATNNLFVFSALEQPDSGNLITFTQFLVVTILTYAPHFSPKASAFFLKPRAVPLLSGGSVMTMLVGWAWGKRYTRIQGAWPQSQAFRSTVLNAILSVLSVVMLTVGIITAATADARSKGKSFSSSSASTFDLDLLTGLSILFVAQLLSAIMGLYVQLTYAKYGSHWHENLFYSHTLSLPLFLPLLPSLANQFNKLCQSPPLALSPAILLQNAASSTLAGEKPQLPPILLTPTSLVAVPIHVVALLANAGTQFACIRGVNILASRTSAVGVSIALNVRKLVSLFISILVFGNVLPLGVEVGAAIVFASAALWAWEEGRLGKERKEKEGARKEPGEKKIQ